MRPVRRSLRIWATSSRMYAIRSAGTCRAGAPKSKVACATATNDNMVFVTGDITTQINIDYAKFVQAAVDVDSVFGELAKL